jgi:hypothetical protein
MPEQPVRAKSAGWRRWLNVFLRGAHLVTVILLGATLLGAALDSTMAVWGMVVTGLAMFVLDFWNKPGHLREVSGLAVLLKLLLVGWMAMDASSRFALFWVIVAGSAFFAHAPARFRHATLFGTKA